MLLTVSLPTHSTLQVAIQINSVPVQSAGTSTPAPREALYGSVSEGGGGGACLGRGAGERVSVCGAAGGGMWFGRAPWESGAVRSEAEGFNISTAYQGRNSDVH